MQGIILNTTALSSVAIIAIVWVVVYGMQVKLREQSNYNVKHVALSDSDMYPR